MGISLKPLPEPGSILVVAPHPDDVIMGAGLVYRARAAGKSAVVANITCGDKISAFERRYLRQISWDKDPRDWVNYGLKRIEEEKLSHSALSGKPEELYFLGYPDSELGDILQMYRACVAQGIDPSTPYFSKTKNSNRIPYAEALSPEASYSGASIIKDLETLIACNWPDTILVTHPNDHHPDHSACFYFLNEAVVAARTKRPDYQPRILTFLDSYGFTVGTKLLARSSGHPTLPFGHLPSKTEWYDTPLSAAETEAKTKAVSVYKSQMSWEHPFAKEYDGTNSYLYGWVSKHETYGAVLDAKEDPEFQRRVKRVVLASRVLSLPLRWAQDLINQ